jgi:hypothetical protein
MNKQIILALLLCLAMFGLARGGPSGEATQTAFLSGEQLKSQVVTASGGAATGGGFTLSSSLGQTAVGKGTSASFHLVHGFLQNFSGGVAPCADCGDADGNGFINISDAVALVSFVFNGAPVPGDCGNPPYQYGRGDADGNGFISISDAVLLLSYIFSGIPVPHCKP